MGAQSENGLRAGGKNVAVIGVTPPGFQFPGDTRTVLNIFTAPLAQLCVPLALTPQTPSARSTHCLEAIGRLKPGVTPNQAQAENNAIEQDLVKQYPRAYIGSDVSTVPPGFGSQVPGNHRFQSGHENELVLPDTLSNLQNSVSGMHETSTSPAKGEFVCCRVRVLSHPQGKHRSAGAGDRRRIKGP